MNFPGAEEYIIGRLKKELPVTMLYHTLEHTLDVQQVTKQLIRLEKIDAHKGMILETAAIFHDAGMIITYQDHELASLEIVRKVLPDYAYSEHEIAEICKLILATQLPQRPVTYEEQVLCDADMDNLGRDDFFIQSLKLKLELELSGVGKFTLKTWLINLLRFMEDHEYYTATSKILRQAKKKRNVGEIKEIVNLF
jgi:uncharacterized protein